MSYWLASGYIHRVAGSALKASVINDMTVLSSDRPACTILSIGRQVIYRQRRNNPAVRGYGTLPVATKTPKTSLLVALARNEDLRPLVDGLFRRNYRSLDMRRLILGTIATVAIAVSMSSAGFAAPAFAPHEHGVPSPQATNVHRVDYYWNHHHYRRRDWDRDHHHWHYYD